MSNAALQIDTPEDVQPRKTGSMIDELYELKQRKADINKSLKEINEDITRLENELIEKFDGEETTMGSGKSAKAYINETVIPQVEDWDEVFQYIAENDAFHLVQRKMNAAPFREMLELDENIPGVKPFTKRTLSTRKNS